MIVVTLAGDFAAAETATFTIALAVVGQADAPANPDASAKARANALLGQAREAIRLGRLSEADRLISQAESLGVEYDPLTARFQDTPAKLRRELGAAREGDDAVSPAELKRVAAGYLSTARQALQRGDKQAAIAFYQKAVSQQASFGAGEFSPLMMAVELRRAGIDQSQLNVPSNEGQLNRLPPIDQQPADAPVGGNSPAANQYSATGQRQVQVVGDSSVKVYEFGSSRPRAEAAAPPATRTSTVKREVMRLVAEAQAALNRGDIYLAEQYTDRAESMRVPDTAFAAGETRPWEIRMQIDRTVARGSEVRQASSMEPQRPYRPQRYPVDQGLYRPQYDTTQNVPANQLTAPSNGGNQRSPAYQAGGSAEFPPQEQAEAPPTLPPEIDLNSPETAGPLLYEEGLKALQDGKRGHALFFFRHAWRFEEAVDPVLRQQIQDKLSQMSVTEPAEPRPLQPRADANPPAPSALEEASDEQTILRQRLFREIAAETTAADRLKMSDPRGALKQIEELRARVADAQLDDASRRQLLLVVDRSLNEIRAHIEQNAASIELDEQNASVKENIDRQRRMQLETQGKLAQLVEEFNQLMDQHRYAEAEVIAKQAFEIAPNEEVVQTMNWKARFVRNHNAQMAISDAGDRGREGQWQSLEESAGGFDDRNPFHFPDAHDWGELTKRRRDLDRDRNARLSPVELEIQAALKKPVEVRFRQRPLAEVLATLGKMTGVNVFLDPQGLRAEGVASDMPVDLDLEQPISLKSALNLILEPLRLSYVIQDEVLRVTSEQTRESDVYTEVYNVADLVIPIPNFVPSYNLGLPGAIAAAHRNVGIGGAIGSQSNIPLTLAQNDSAGPINPLALAQVGLEGYSGSRSPQSVGSGPGGLGGGVQADFDSLIELVTTTIAPDSWDEVGGPGSVAPFETTLSLVVSQTQDTHEDIADLLDQLRRLQDLQVTIEVRFITLSDDFFERIGVDFDFQIDDNVTAANDPRLNPQNEDTSPSVTIGLGQDGLPTADLDLTFNQDSFGSAVPQFGGFDAATAANFGFAILSDIEVFFLLQASQGDSRTNILQAPKVTLFNGQQAFVSDTAQTPFVTSIVPIVGDFAVGQQPVITVLSEGTSLSVQAVVSSDRRFVRLTLVPFFSRIGEVKEFTFEGSVSSDSGSVTVDPTDEEENVVQNQTVTRTGTTVQLPTFAFTTVTTTVSVPDGGTVLLGGIKRLSEGRNERGVPMLSKVPYISRLFRNVGIGRTSQSLMMMVTPRIIIQEEEEERLGIEVTP